MSLKQKNIALLIGIILLLWISYQFSFSKTLELKSQYNTLKYEQELLSNVSQKLMSLNQQNVYYDSILKSKKISTERSFQNNLLQVITSFADTTNIKVVTFNNPHIYKADNAKILTHSFTLQGNFNQITQLIYLLEQELKLGKIISVDFQKKQDYKRRSEYLECTVLLQQIVD